MLSNLIAWQKLNSHADKTGYLIYNGDLEQKIGNNKIVNWKTFCKFFPLGHNGKTVNN